MDQRYANATSQSDQKPAQGGDYLLARAKRELEKCLRADGCSKSQALRQVHEQFKFTGILKGTDK